MNRPEEDYTDISIKLSDANNTHEYSAENFPGGESKVKQVSS